MKNMIVGADGSENARRALHRIADLADGAAVTVVSAAAGFVDPEEVEEREHTLEETSSLLASRGIEADTVEAHGNPAAAIVDEAKERAAELIVVGTRGRNAAERLLLGSVSTKVVHEAPCDVFVVR